jgi:hypothetical protein
MTDDDYDALSQKQLASIKRNMRISFEDAAVRAAHKLMAKLQSELDDAELEKIMLEVWQPVPPEQEPENFDGEDR